MVANGTEHGTNLVRVVASGARGQQQHEDQQTADHRQLQHVQAEARCVWLNLDLFRRLRVVYNDVTRSTQAHVVTTLLLVGRVHVAVDVHGGVVKLYGH